jgi:hypothetical protein
MPDNPLDVLSRAEKVELLKRIDAATRASIRASSRSA